MKAGCADTLTLAGRVSWIDNRAEEFPDPVPSRVERIIASRPADLVAEAPRGAGFLALAAR